MERKREFYMLYVEGGHSPVYKHNTPDDAKKEAERLAELTSKPVYILVSQYCVELQKYHYSDCRPLTNGDDRCEEVSYLPW